MPSRLSRILLSFSVVMALGTASLTATPTTYLFDPTGSSYESLGTGTFTFDIGAALDDYAAASVLGGGATFGTWASVNFIALSGGVPSLVITNQVDSSISFSLPAIGGGEINAGSRADLEWANFIVQSSIFGFSITPLTTSVPEGGPSIVLIGGVLGGLCFIARSRTPAHKAPQRGDPCDLQEAGVPRRPVRL